MSTYSDLLKDPRWQKRRLEILNRDDFTCRCCHDKTKELHVHHCSYDHNIMPWDYPNNWLITLCKDCHLDEEALKSGNFLESLLVSGFPRVILLRKLYDEEDRIKRIINHFRNG